MTAACHNHDNILIQLLKAGAMINEAHENNEYNESNNALIIATALLKAGAMINKTAENGEYNASDNALIIATAAGSFECLKILLEYGASINYQCDCIVDRCQ